jgi:hypothetical protein
MTPASHKSTKERPLSDKTNLRIFSDTTKSSFKFKVSGKGRPHLTPTHLLRYPLTLLFSFPEAEFMNVKFTLHYKPVSNHVCSRGRGDLSTARRKTLQTFFQITSKNLASSLKITVPFSSALKSKAIQRCRWRKIQIQDVPRRQKSSKTALHLSTS